MPNGLRIVVLEHHRRPVITVTLVLPRGSLADPPDGAGFTSMAVNLASDYYEPVGEGAGDDPQDDRSFRMRVSRLGGQATFDVQADYSMVQIVGYSRDAATYLNLMAEAVRKPRHGEQSFRGRRNHALDAVEDEFSDAETLRQLLERSAFGPNHPYTRSPLGTTQSLTKMRLKDVIEHQREVFSPAGATVLVVGDVRPAQVLADAASAFGPWERGEPSPLVRIPPPSLPRDGREVRYMQRQAASTLVVCATRPLPEVAGNDGPLRVLVGVLGQGIGSRLMTRLRNEHGLTYDAWAGIVRRGHATALIACSAIDAKRADLGARVFREVLEGLRKDPPTEEEIELAKGLWVAGLESSFDDIGKATETWIETLFLGEGAPRIEQERAEIERVTGAEVRKLAAKLFDLERFRWVVSGDRAAASRAFEASGFGKLQSSSLQ